MLTKVEVVTEQGTTLALPLQDTSAGFLVKGIEGLDPVKASIVRSKFAQIDGTRRQGSSREDRNLVIKLGFTPDYATNDIRSLRDYLYDYLMPKSSVLLKFYMDDVLFIQTYGEVETCETDLFSEEPEVIASLICFDPDFSAPDSVVVGGNSVVDSTEQELIYPGSSPVGFKFKLNVNQVVTTFTMYNRTPSGRIYSLVFVGSLVSGDTLDIHTISGAKGAWMTRAGIQTPVLHTISPSSTWLNLFKGVNNIRVAASGIAMPFEIEYVAKYGAL